MTMQMHFETTRASRVRAAIAVLLSSAALTACAVGPNFEQPDAPAQTASVVPQLPDQQLQMGKPLPADWWTMFASPALNDLVAQAFASNQDLAAAQSSV